MTQELDKTWDIVRLKNDYQKLHRECTAYRLENAQLRADLKNVRDFSVPYSDQGDSPDDEEAFCGVCDESLGALYDAKSWEFCPYCGAHLDWGEYGTEVAACS